MKGSIVAVDPADEIQMGKEEGTKKKLLGLCYLTWIHTYIQVLKRTRYSNAQHISKLKTDTQNKEQDLSLMYKL